MKTIVEFLDECKARTNSTSDSNLAYKIGLTRSAICDFRNGRALPSDETVRKLALRAGLDPNTALLWLNVWRAKGPSKAHYLDMIKKLTACFLAVFLLSIPAPQSEAKSLKTLDNLKITQKLKSSQEYILCAFVVYLALMAWILLAFL